MAAKFQYQPRSFHLQWHITERCNLKCKHCYFDKKFLENELSLKELLRILEEYISFIVKKIDVPKNRSRISITGGEPLVRKDFFNFLEKIYQYRNFTRYGVLTNGILMDERKLKRMKKLGIDYIQVSLEGMKKKNDEIRGAGSFEKIEKATQLLVKHRINTGVSVTVTE